MKNISHILALTSLSLIFFIFTTSIILLAFGINIGYLNAYLAFLITQAAVSYITKSPYKTLFCLFICFLTLFILCFISSNIYDISYDGLAYHQPAIKMLTDCTYNNTHPWIEYFPKAPWIIEAALAKFFPFSIAGSKGLNMYMSLSAVVFGYIALTKVEISKNSPLLILLSFLAAFNTVNNTQMQTFMVDGLLSSVMIIFISSCTIYLKDKNKTALLLIFMSLCLMINVKTSGAAYGIVLLAGVLLFVKDKMKFIVFCAVTVFLGLFLFGFNSYGKNLITHKNPFYPIGSKVEILTQDNIPSPLNNKNRFEKLIISVYSRVNNDGNTNSRAVLKAPFSFSLSEFKAITHDTRISGFGALWGLIFTISILSLIFMYKKPYYKYLLISSAALFASVLLNPECWWARFIPQLSLFPIFICTFSIKNKIKLLPQVLMILLFANNFASYFLIDW